MLAKPKVELHVHLDGAVRPQTIWDIAVERKLPLPTANQGDMVGLLNIPINKAKTLTEFLQKFDIFLPYIVGHAETIKRISYEFCEDLAKDNVVYTEARIAPHLLATTVEQPMYSDGHLTPRQVVEVVLQGLKEGMKDFNVKVNLVLCCMWHMPAWSEEILDLCVEFKDKGVVAMDIAGEESTITDQKHMDAFKAAKEFGVHRTIHAGERGPPEKVREVVYEMYAERIGHGYQTIRDPELYKQLLHDDIHFELCPLSSLIAGAVPDDFCNHPIHRIIGDSANFSLNTDDPTITGYFLQGEYQFAKDSLNVSEKHLVLSTLNAARSSFLPEVEKAALLQTLKEAYTDEIKLYGINV